MDDIAQNRKYSGYRWVIEGIVLFGYVGLSILWLSPSPLLTKIVGDLSITYAQGGSIISIIALMIAIFTFAGGFLLDKTGIKQAFSIGLGILGLGGSLVYFADSYLFLIFTRILVGIGFGIILPIPGALVMQWFPKNERPYLNTVNSSLTYVGMSIAFSFTIPLYNLLGSWNITLSIYGLYVLAIALIWTIFGKAKKAVEDNDQKIPYEQESNDKKESALKQIMKRKEAWFLALALFGGMWEFQFFTSFLPAYYETVKGLEPALASQITGTITFVGIFAGIIVGLLMGVIGLRKIFMWPLHILVFIGLIGSITFSPGPLLYLSVGLIGFGAAGWTPVLLTVPMELKNMTPEKVGAVHSLIFGVGYTAAFFSPIVGGWLAAKIGLYNTLFIFAFSQIIPVTFTFIIPETGPRAKKAKKEKSPVI